MASFLAMSHLPAPLIVHESDETTTYPSCCISCSSTYNIQLHVWCMCEIDMFDQCQLKIFVDMVSNCIKNLHVGSLGCISILIVPAW